MFLEKPYELSIHRKKQSYTRRIWKSDRLYKVCRGYGIARYGVLRDDLQPLSERQCHKRGCSRRIKASGRDKSLLLF